MKLIKLIMILGALLLTNLSAAVISGYCFEDVNGDGIKDPGEICAEEAVWAKIVNLSTGHVEVSKNLYSIDPETSGYFEFNTHSKTGQFKVFLDNNADGKDTVATPPVNTHFTVDPLGDGTDTNRTNGETYYTIDPGEEDTIYENQDFGFQFGGDCVCEGADGIIIKKTININGDVSDWESVHTDADNNVCDHGDSEDKDAIVQSTGRNLVQFTWTGDNDFAYGFTRRVGSSTNTQTFIYYADRDGDGRMEAEDFALVAGWQGNTGATSLYYYPYLPADLVNGDSMVWTQADIDAGKLPPGGQTPDTSWIGSGDGYTLAGNLDTGSGVDLIAAGNGLAQGVTEASGGLDDAGVTMEWRVRWDAIGLTPFQGITYHISTMNSSVNDNNPPGQVDDNMAGCYGEATLRYCGVTLVPDRSIILPSGSVGPVYFEHNLTNTGNGDENLTLSLTQTESDFTVTYIEYYNDANGNGVEDLGEENLTGGPLALGAGESINLLVKIGLPTGLDDNIATGEINATTTSCAVNKSAVVYDQIRVLPLNFDLDITKEVSDDNASWVDTIELSEGSPAYYRITVTNNGPDGATDVTVNDVLPANVNYIGYYATQGTYGAGQWMVGNLALDGSAELFIDVNVSQTAGDLTVIQNIASTTDTNDTDTNDQDDANITAIHIPVVNLQIVKTVSNPTPYEGEDINYTITVTKFGIDDAENVVVNDILPPWVSYVDSTASVGSYDETTGIWDIGTMSNSVETLIIQATVDTNATLHNPIVNTASVSTDTTDTNPDDDIASATFNASNPADLGITKTVDNPNPQEGDTIVYTISVTNYGPLDATNIYVQEEPFDGNLSITGTDTTLGTFNAPWWHIPELNVSQTAVLTVTAMVDLNSTGDILINNVIIDTERLDQNDTNGENDKATAIVIVGCPCDNISSDSASAMNKTVGLLMICMTLLIGLIFVRREEKYNRNER
ncbi:DUF11 domain-containing protein [Sulfurovum sp. AR]|uniref:DUF11 domain-containing protein n=1 Tax=Sulfurovum sp. AR TaxID=1165841 RepID=UPI00025C4A9F|nr:DUF11 domain-containing protein [Sulfurovum sp. AR]EIF50938.1 hypothetical protein SULAR_06203 [Sulfurovum sp. AR]